MPYLKEQNKPYIQFGIPKSPGELNYLFTIIAKGYWEDNPKYQTINDIIGALEGAKLEFYRRIAVPYEDTKIKENGDVYSV